MKIHWMILFILVSKLLSANPDTLYYSSVKSGEINGRQLMWMNGDREYHFFYQFNDRGRGDSIYATVNTNDSDLIAGVEISGVDYFKNPYSEKYTVGKDSVRSNVNDETKVKPFRHELYAGSMAPGMIEPQIRYLLRQKDLQATSSTGGVIRVLPLHEKIFSMHGDVQRLYLCEMYYGENSPPYFIWLDSDKHFFASVSDWFSTIRRGSEVLTDTLIRLQENQSKDYYAKQMQSLSDVLPDELAFIHVRLYDSENATVLENQTVLIRQGKIVLTGLTGKLKFSPTTKVIDATGKTILPGLWDMHTHYQKESGLSYLAGGVTHVRDMGNSSRVMEMKSAIEENKLLGPDISFLSGFIDQAGPFQGPTGAIIKSLDEGINAVDGFAKKGYGQIKLYSSIDPKWVAPLAKEAHRLNMRMCGHIPAFMLAQDAIRDGYDEITHINMVMLNFLGDTLDTRSRNRFLVPGDHSKDLDLESKPVTDFLALMKEKHTALDPTMNVFAGMYALAPGDTDASLKPVLSWMPADQRENAVVQTSMGGVEKRVAYRESFGKMMLMLKKIYDNGNLIVSGTDGGDAIALHHELEIYVEAGIPPLKALQCATYNAALDCNLLSKYGTISPGKPADFIIVDGKPDLNISDVRRVERVIKNNRIYFPKKLYNFNGWGYYY